MRMTLNSSRNVLTLIRVLVRNIAPARMKLRISVLATKTTLGDMVPGEMCPGTTSWTMLTSLMSLGSYGNSGPPTTTRLI